MKVLILKLIFLLGCKTLLAQITISGYLTDSLNNPIPYANVYLQNTTIGDDTDSKGFYHLFVPKQGLYELTASCIGFQTKSQVIQVRNKSISINFQLPSSPLSLDDVVVEAKNKSRVRNYSLFTKLFLGTTPNARNCKIHNLKDLRLYQDKKGNITRGYSVRPLVIENKALGYLLKYYLEDFSYNDSLKLVKFSGKLFYKPLKGSEKKIEVWEENRKKAYYGSEMHLLRSLYASNCSKNGFNIYEFERDPVSKYVLPIDTLHERDLETGKSFLNKSIFYKKPLLINYLSPSNTSLIQESIVEITDTITVSENGTINNYYAITFSGKIGEDRVANKLPYDFYPETSDTFPIAKNDFLESKLDKMILPTYENYYSDSHEQVYTHFNKSLYLPGEDIWFTNYILNQNTGLLSDQTKILYAELYSPEGKLIEHKVLPVNLGIAHNSFKLPKQPGNYTFRAYTNWMKNYESPENLSITIKVEGMVEKKGKPALQNYDIQFLPESGTLLAGIINRVGIKAIDSNGKGIAVHGEVVDEQNNRKSSFELNSLGMGDFRIIPKNGTVYRARVTLPDGNEQYFELPQVQEKGVVVSINNRFKEKVAIQLVSNIQTIADSLEFNLLIHNQGNTLKTATIKLSPEKTLVTFFLKDSELANGSNCVTVFNHNFEPVAERLFFYLKEDVLGNIKVHSELKNDSVEFNVFASDTLDNPLQARLSMSILPEKTICDSFSTSLYAEALLKPGLCGHIENPSYYFEKKDDEHLQAIDLLFLTQGWRKYDWKAITSNKPQPFTFESSFAVTGKIEGTNGSHNSNQVVTLVSPRNKLLLINNTDNNNEFLFPDLYLEDKSVIIVTANSGDGKKKDWTIQASVTPLHQPDSLIEIKNLQELTPNATDDDYINLLPKEILLKNVEVVAKKKTSPFDGATYKPGPTEKIYEVTKENYFKYPTLQRLLSAEFNVSIRRDTGYYYFRLNRARSSDSVFVVIDDINFRNDYANIDRINIDAIEAISVVENGFPVLEDVAAIIIKTRRIPIDFGNSTPPNIKYLNVKGFSPPTSYYVPQYSYSPENNAYRKYATIFWKPDITTNHEGKATFRFAVPKGVDGLKVRTEGFSENGMIFLDNSTVKLLK